MNEPAKVAERAAEPETNRAAEAEQLRARYRVRLMNALFGIGALGVITELVWLTGGFALLVILPIAPGLMMIAARIGIQEGTRYRHGIPPVTIAHRLWHAGQDLGFGLACSICFVGFLGFSALVWMAAWQFLEPWVNRVIEKANPTPTDGRVAGTAVVLLAVVAGGIVRFNVEILSRMMPAFVAQWWRLPMDDVGSREDRRSAAVLCHRLVLALGLSFGLYGVWTRHDDRSFFGTAWFLFRRRYVSNGEAAEMLISAIGYLLLLALAAFWFVRVLPWMARRSVRFAYLATANKPRRRRRSVGRMRESS